MLNKIVLEEDGLVVGRNQLSTTGGGVFVNKNLAIGGVVNTPNLYSYSNTTLSGNVTMSGNVTVDGSTVTIKNTSRIVEKVNVLNLSPGANVTVNLAESGIHLFRQPPSSNLTLNFTGTSTESLAAYLSPGQSISAIVGITNGSTPYYPNRYQIDGGTITPRWQANTTPSSGNANAIDFYAITIMRLTENDASMTPTYLLLASQTQFK